MWWTIAAMGANALMQANKAKRDQETMKQHNLAQAEMTRYSPWTGQSGKITPYTGPSAFEGAVGGAFQGAAMGQQLNSAFSAPDATKGFENKQDWQNLEQGKASPVATLYGTNPWGRA